MRFFLPAADWPRDAPEACLDPAESRHAATVLRLQPGDSVSVFDGAGRTATGTVLESGKREVRLRLSAARTVPPPATRLALAVAIPKGSTMEWIIEKAVELGASEVLPLLTQRTVVRLAAAERGERRQKWERVAIEACKQCGQNWLPTVHPPRPLREALAAAPPASFAWPLVASLRPEAQPLAATLQTLPPPDPGGAILWIGPEGDFTADEYAELHAAGALPVSLGPITLRVETAALCGLSILRFAAESRAARTP